MRELSMWCVLLLILLSSSAAAAERLALVGGTLVDGTLAEPLRNSVVLVEGERIVAVGTVASLPVPAGVTVISTEGMTVMPGLWDMHVHLMINGHADYAHWDKTYPSQFRDVIMPASAKQLLLAGVTGARDLGGPLEESLAVRDAINAGRIPGPTLFVSGPFIQKKPYPGTEQFRWGVDSPADARAKVRRLAQAGVDVVKLIDQDQMSDAEVRAVVDEAHAHGLPVVAHAHRPEEIRRGLAFGVDCFEHTGLGAAPEYPEDVMAALRERTGNMAAGPLFWTPTIEGLFNFPHTVHRWRCLARGPDAGDRRRHSPVARASRAHRLLPADAATRADTQAQVRAVARSRRGDADRHRFRHPDEIPQRQHLERARRVGEPARRAGDRRDPRGHLLARRGDEGRQGLRQRGRRQVRRHHCGQG